MKRAIASIVACLGLVIATAAPAMAKPKKAPANQSQAQQKHAKSYDFTGDTLTGDLIKPDGDFINPREFASHTSLIKVRTNFIKEIIKSARDL